MLARTKASFDGPLTIEQSRYGDDVIVLSLSGELDLAVAEMARQILEPVVDEPGAMVVVDLTDLEFIGVKGIQLLYELGRARPDKDTLRLLPSRHPGVNKILELTDVRSVIPVVAAARVTL